SVTRSAHLRFQSREMLRLSYIRLAFTLTITFLHPNLHPDFRFCLAELIRTHCDERSTCFEVNNNNKNWNEAQICCEYENMTLAIVKSRALLIQVIGNFTVDIWVGAKEEKQANSFMWFYNGEVLPQDMLNGKATDAEEKCVYINKEFNLG
ncbi:unnamed protein product, partial [Lymnaea stagnalis]